jgi:Tol biopolymer transport system component
MVVQKVEYQSDVYISELEAGGRRLKSRRRLTLDDRNDSPSAWTPDSKTVLFWSDRNGTLDIFRQAIDEDSAEPIATGPEIKRWPVVSPDGSWILYISSSVWSGPARIMRVPTLGGPSEVVLEDRDIGQLACAQPPSSLCVFSVTTPERKQVVWSAFDDVRGRDRELARVDLSKPFFSWALSPDGSRLAFAQHDDHEGRIQLIPLAGGEPRQFAVKGYTNLSSVFWAADGKGLFVDTVGGVLRAPFLYVDLQGNAYVLTKHFTEWGVPSPNGRYLAENSLIEQSNLWLLENF